MNKIIEAASSSSFRLSKKDAGAMGAIIGAELQKGVAPTVETDPRLSLGVAATIVL